MFLFRRRTAQGSRLRALRELYHGFVSEKSPEAKGRALLLQWLTPAQRRQFEEQGYFDVVGCATQRRYRVQYGSVANVQEIDFEGQSAGVLCFAPEGYLVPGDVMLAQKIALETDELATLAVANRVAPVGRRRGSGGVGGPDSLSLQQPASMIRIRTVCSASRAALALAL